MDRQMTELLKLAEDIKRLLILVLLKQGVYQVEVAKALGVTQATVSKLFPGGLRAKSRRQK